MLRITVISSRCSLATSVNVNVKVPEVCALIDAEINKEAAINVILDKSFFILLVL